MKKSFLLLCLIVTLIMLSACMPHGTTPTQTPANNSNPSPPTQSTFTTPAITNGLDLTIEQVGGIFHGDSMVLDSKDTSSEEPKESADLMARRTDIVYNNLGISLTYDDDGTLLVMRCDSKCTISGAGAGMTFAQIKDKLGDAPINKTWYRTSKQVAYELAYQKDGYLLDFISPNKDGTDSILNIWRHTADLCGTGRTADTPLLPAGTAKINANTEIAASGVTLGEMYECLNTNKQDLLKKLGSDFLCNEPFDGVTGYYYESTGMSIVFSSFDDKRDELTGDALYTAKVECILFFGGHLAMNGQTCDTLTDIRKQLGTGKLIKGIDDTSGVDVPEYTLKYSIGDMRINYITWDEISNKNYYLDIYLNH